MPEVSARFRRFSFALPLALAAAQAGGAAASTFGTGAEAPSFACKGAPSSGGTIAWANGVTIDAPRFDVLDGSGAVVETSPFDCAGGTLSELVVGRKASQGTKEFIKIVMAEVIVVTSTPSAPAGSTPVKTSVSQRIVLGGRTPIYETTWEVLTAYDHLDPVTGAVIGGSSTFLGFAYASTEPYADPSAVLVRYDSAQRTLSFLAPTQLEDGLLTLTSMPVALRSPGPASLLAVGLVGLAALGSRRGPVHP